MSWFFTNLIIPKSEPKSDLTPYFPTIYSESSQFKQSRSVSSLKPKLKPRFQIEEKQREISRNNEILLNKMLEIDSSPSPFTKKETKTKLVKQPNEIIKKLRKDNIEHDCFKLRLRNIKATYNMKKFQNDYNKHCEYIHKSRAVNAVNKSYNKSMKNLDKMIREEMKRREEYKTLMSNN